MNFFGYLAVGVAWVGHAAVWTAVMNHLYGRPLNKYFLKLWRLFTGVAIVESTKTRARPRALARLDRRARSTQSSSGFVGDSAMTRRVVGLSACSNAARSPGGTTVCSMPMRGRIVVTSWRMRR